MFSLSIHMFAFYLGCELSSSQTTAMFEAEDDLLENQFFIKTVRLLSCFREIDPLPWTETKPDFV